MCLYGILIIRSGLTTLESTVNELRVMTGVLLALVLLLILVMLGMLLHLTKNMPKLTLPVFFRNAKKGAANMNDKNPTHKTCNGVADPNVAVGRIANHQVRFSLSCVVYVKILPPWFSEQGTCGPVSQRNFQSYINSF